ncbi:7TM diverse intracellular signaling domain-containing protein [Oligoflexus tunisiensis]|uniref:7TM diverse intracellular signaling domain-containing protein n=1 Tax=Oligoflexus tunisiensis TaxID=708132 RepID=UPI000A607D8F|nr:7TM diverse intracellular signaling domain-containing protein [Oligoflexus tunisiensis]
MKMPHARLRSASGCTWVWLVFIACLLHLARPCHAASYEARQGTLDLKGWNGDPVISLRGEWHFFWNELLQPEQVLERLASPDYQARFAKPSIRFPEVAPGLIKDNFGVATYVLRLRGLPQIPMAFSSISAYSSSNVYLFAADEARGQKPRVLIGQLASNREGSIPALAMDGFLPFEARPDQDYYFVIQVANYFHTWGGLWLPPEIGSYESVHLKVRRADRAGFLTLGFFILVGLYNLSFYLRRHEDKGSLYLALFVFTICLRCWVLADWSSRQLSDPVMDYEWKMKVNYLTIAWPYLIIAAFLRSYFPGQTPRWIPRALWAVYAVPILLVLFTSNTSYGIMERFFVYGGVVWSVILISCIARAAWAREEGASYSLAGGLCLLVGGILDTAYTLGYSFLPANAISWGLVVFVSCQSQIVAVRFAIAFRKSEHLSRSLAQEVDRQTRDIKSILRSIRQGIFTLLPDRRIGAQYSDFLHSIVGSQDIEGATIQSLLLDHSTLSADQKSHIQATLDASLGENIVAFEMNSGNLIQELQVLQPGEATPRLLEIDWNPICNKEGIVEKILISLRDVTEVRSLKQEALQHEEDMKIIIELTQIPEDKFHRFISKTSEFLTENRDLIVSATGHRVDVIKRLYMNMHTIKGAARTYYLQAISAASHEVEQYYASLQRKEAAWDQDKLLRDLDLVETVIGRYQNVGEDRLGWDLKQRFLKIGKVQFEACLSLLQTLDSRYLHDGNRAVIQAIQSQLVNLGYDKLANLIEEAARGLDSMARDLRKESPRIQVTGAMVTMKERGSELIHNMLVHLFRNSMDHGIETPDLRVRRGKPPAGTITIQAAIRARQLLVSYQDDGNGLDLEAIRSKGIESGILQADQDYSDQAIADLIFHSGFSTRNAVSEISGRGMGLDAVRTYAEAEGATVVMKLQPSVNRQSVPFILEFTLPAELFWILGEDADHTPGLAARSA